MGVLDLSNLVKANVFRQSDTGLFTSAPLFITPWWRAPQYAATATDGSVVYPNWIFDGVNQRYAKSASPTGSVSQVAFSGLLEGFTRASSATYFDASGTLQTAATNVPRFNYDPATLQPLGLLVEEARTNLLAESNVFDNGYYTVEDVTLTASYESLKGISGSLMREGTGGAGHSLRRSISFVSGTTYTFTGFIKQGVGTRNFRLALPSAAFGATTNAIFNPSTGAIVTTAGTVTADSQSMSGGIFRVRLTATATATATSEALIHLIDGTSNSYQGNGTSGVIVAGVQLEVGSTASSYIPTAGSTVTRAQDVPQTSAIGNFIGATGGTIITAFTPHKIAQTMPIWSLGTSISNRITLASSSGSAFTKLRAQVVDAGNVRLASDSTGASNMAVGQKSVCVFAYTSGSYYWGYRGDTLDSGAIGGSLPNLTGGTFVVGANGHGLSNPYSGLYPVILSYSKVLTQAESQRIMGLLA